MEVISGRMSDVDVGGCGVAEIPGARSAEGAGSDAASRGASTPHAAQAALQGQVMATRGRVHW